MKKITLLAFALTIIGFTSCDKETKAPQKVTEAFAKKFPAATDVEWAKESETEWEAEFKVNGKEHSANFTQDGTWTETEFEIDKAEIPQIVMNALKAEFEDYEIEEMEISETVEGKVYEFGIEKGNTEMEVAINANGTIVKKEQKKAEEKGEESEEDEEIDND